MKMRATASAVVAVLVALVMSGCMFVTPQQTSHSYTPADGVNGRVGDVEIRNVFLVSRNGSTASVIGVLANTSSSAATVTLQFATTSGTSSEQVSVPANGSVSMKDTTSTPAAAAVTTDDASVVLQGIDAPLGGLFTMGFGSGSAKPVSLQLPVLTGDLDGYQTLYPTPSPTATESDSPSPTPTTTD